MRGVSHDVIWVQSQIRVIIFRWRAEAFWWPRPFRL